LRTPASNRAASAPPRGSWRRCRRPCRRDGQGHTKEPEGGSVPYDLEPPGLVLNIRRPGRGRLRHRHQQPHQRERVGSEPDLAWNVTLPGEAPKTVNPRRRSKPRQL
jgi:hypothetical protein